MNRLRWVTGLSLGGALLLLAPPSHGEIVETPPGSISSVQLSLTMDNDWQFIDRECLFIPVLATYGRADDTSIIGELTVSKPSNLGVSNDATFLVLPGDPVAGQLLDEIFVCPADGTGEFRLDTVVRAIQPTTEFSFALDPLTFWVRPAVTTMNELTARAIKGGTRVAGVVRAGEADATGFAEVRVQKPRSSRWVRAGRLSVERGSFDGVLEQSVPVGSRVKVSLIGCSWCSRVTGSTRVK